MNVPHDDRLVAAIDLLGRSGAKSVQLRYDDDPEPTVWVVDAQWGDQRECAGGMDPATAAMRLVREVAQACAHCGRPMDVALDWDQEQPLADVMCWFVYDPETKKFRRSCEGETTGRAFGRDPRTGATVGRNDPCPCESGRKWKHCHGGPNPPPR